MDNDFLIPLDLQLNDQLWNQLVKLRAGYQCESCGYTPPARIEEFKDRRKKGLHAHHKDGNHANSCLANGECLCIGCHARETRLLEYAEGRGRGGWGTRCEEGCKCKRHEGNGGRRLVVA